MLQTSLDHNSDTGADFTVNGAVSKFEWYRPIIFQQDGVRPIDII